MANGIQEVVGSIRIGSIKNYRNLGHRQGAQILRSVAKL